MPRSETHAIVSTRPRVRVTCRTTMRISPSPATPILALAFAALPACRDKAPPPAPAAAAAPVPSVSASARRCVASAAASASAAPSAVAPPPRPISEAQAALVWQAPGKGAKGFKTVWVEPGPGGPVVKRERAEPVVATRQALFALRITSGADATIEAVPLGSGKTVEVATAHVESCYQKGAKAEVSLQGAMGSVVFAAAHGWEYDCEAPHPRWSDHASRTDLDSGAELPLTPFPGLARLTTLAAAKFKATHGEDGGGCLMEPKETPSLYNATFAYDGRGVLRGTYVFIMQSNYMCGSGPGHYTIPEELHDSSLPDSVATWKRAPEWLVPYLAKHPSIGVSPLPPELNAEAAASEFVTAPVPPPPKP